MPYATVAEIAAKLQVSHKQFEEFRISLNDYKLLNGSWTRGTEEHLYKHGVPRNWTFYQSKHLYGDGITIVLARSRNLIPEYDEYNRHIGGVRQQDYDADRERYSTPRSLGYSRSRW